LIRLDPGIHHFLTRFFWSLDCRVMPGNDSTNCPTHGVPNIKAPNVAGTAHFGLACPGFVISGA
jgi:hypothetical protein